MIPAWYLSEAGKQAIADHLFAMRVRRDFIAAMRAASARWGM
jgi:hypothetical protein